MDLDTFDRLAARTKLWPHQKLMAEAYLCRRQGSMRQIARDWETNHWQVLRAVHRVLSEYRRKHEIPKHIPVVTIACEPQDVQRFRDYERRFLKRSGFLAGRQE